MSFYILRDGLEGGPYTWVQVYLMLRKGELSYSDFARSEAEAEFTLIEALALWNEGSDVGPLTWEEVLLLREETYLPDDIAAKIEGEADYVTLGRLLLDRLGRSGSAERDPSTRLPHSRRWLVAGLSTFALLFLAGAAVILMRSTPESFLTGPEDSDARPVTRGESQALADRASPQHTEVPTEKSPAADVSVLRTNTPVVMNLPAPAFASSDVEFADPLEHIHSRTVVSNASVPAQTIAATALANFNPPTPAAANGGASDPKPGAATLVADVAKPVAEAVGSRPAQVQTPQLKPTPQLGEATSNFFQLYSIKLLRRPPRDTIGVWKIEKNERGKVALTDFLDCLEIQVSTKQNVAPEDVFAKAYFFDSSGKLLAQSSQPSKSGPKANPRALNSMPAIFRADRRELLFFEIPPTLLGQQWKVVVVFGDKEEAKAIAYPSGTLYAMLDFPEKQLVSDRTIRSVRRKRVEDRLVEYVVKTRNPNHPQITLFLRPPKGIADWSEVQGVYALVVLANNVEEVRRRMQALELDGDEAGTFAFANKHKLAILVWGSRSIWNARMNFDDYGRREAAALDRDFDLVANAWEAGIQHFHKEYGLPTSNFILRGNCGAAQWAKRLCLRKPGYFLAAHINMAGSYDKPTAEAARVLWCVTSSEADGGYERSLRFLEAAKQMGYPIVYKAATPKTGIGTLGDEFFEYAMTLKGERTLCEKKGSVLAAQTVAKTGATLEPWPKDFAAPPFYADVVNQEVFPSDQVEMIPSTFRSAIPTKRMAEIWMGTRALPAGVATRR